MLLKSTCDLIREPIQNPDTLYSHLMQFCKQMWGKLIMCFHCGILGMMFNRQTCLRSVHFLCWPEVVKLSNSYRLSLYCDICFKELWLTPAHFLYECSVCVSSSVSRLLIWTTGVCLLKLFSGNEDKNREMPLWWAFKRDVFYKYLLSQSLLANPPTLWP